VEVKPHATLGGISPARASSPPHRPTSMPEVRHYKSAGGGYEKHSPLYAKQVEWQSIAERLGLGASDGATTVDSTTMQCIINLTCQFFAVYTALFIVQSLNRLQIIRREREEKCLNAVTDTVFFVPMVCVLLLTARLRAVQLCKGQTESHGLPQWWVRHAMVACTWSILTLTVLVLIFTALYGEVWETAAKKMAVGSARKVMRTCRSLVMLSIYASFTVICVGTCVMRAPKELWHNDEAPEFNPAMFCTVLLAVTYFAVYLVAALAKVTNELGVLGQTMRFGNAQALLKNATTAVAFAPMLCMLFIAVWMRASQFDIEGKSLPHWMSGFFYVCAVSVVLQTLLAILAGALGVQENSEGGYTVPIGGSAADLQVRVIEAARFILLASFHVGVVAIVFGMYALRPQHGAGSGAHMPPSLQCVMVLASLFFVVYLAMWVLLSIQRYRSTSTGLHGDNIMSTLEQFVGGCAKEAVPFCPMFCILFLAMLVRTLQLKGSMDESRNTYCLFEYIATASILLLTLARVDTVLPRASYGVTTACLVYQYACLTLLYASAIGGVVALFVMAP